MINLNKETAQQGAENQTDAAQYVLSLDEMIEKVKNEPMPEFIYSGIKEHSVGIVFGPSKSGKSIYTEGLGQAIAAQLTEYLGLPLNVSNPKVLFISFEEDYIHRTMRNMKQIESIKATHGVAWMKNYIVATDKMPRYISTIEDWKLLTDIIVRHAPGLVILDSVTRMCQGIEESAVAQQFMKNLRHLSRVTGTSILAIHHTHKMFGQPISMDTIAGSRVIAQELDYAIGINKAPDGTRYIKDVFFRYAPDDKETVTTFTIDENCCLNVTGEEYESKLLSGSDGRRDDSNGNKILAYLSTKAETETQHATWSELETRFVPGEMSRGTLHNQSKKLVKDGKVTKSGDQYKLAG